MSSAAAGEVMGPRPGIAIFSFFQGIAEILLRCAVLVLAVFAFIVACVALSFINAIDEDNLDVINDDDNTGNLPDTPGLVDNSRGACGCVIFLGIAVFAYQPLLILIRFLNCGCINLYIIIFLAIDIIFSGLFIMGYLAATIVAVVTVPQWGDWQDFADDFLPDDFVEDENLYFDRIQGAMGAVAALSFFLMIVFGALGIWMILFLVFKWNKNVVNATVPK